MVANINPLKSEICVCYLSLNRQVLQKKNVLPLSLSDHALHSTLHSKGGLQTNLAHMDYTYKYFKNTSHYCYAVLMAQKTKKTCLGNFALSKQCMTANINSNHCLEIKQLV